MYGYNVFHTSRYLNASHKGEGLPVGAGNDRKVGAGVMPDVIGHLVARRDRRSVPAMT